MDIRSRSPFPSLSTQTLRDYFGSDGQRSRAAAHELFERYGTAIETRVLRSLQRRHGALAADAIQEAWVRCLSQLHKDKAAYMQSRPERPSVGLLMTTFTMRAVWQLEQQARRRARRDQPPTHEAGSGGDQRIADTAVTLEDLHHVFERVWAQLLSRGDDARRQCLQRIGPVMFFAGDWQMPDNESLTPCERSVVVEQLEAAAQLLRELLEQHYGLDPSAQRRFLRWLLPSVASRGPR